MTDLSSAPLPSESPEDHVRGPRDAPTIVIYGDYACARCALAHARIRRAPPLRVLVRHFPLRARYPRGPALACAVEAAGLQEHFWSFHDALFEEPGRQEDPDLWRLGERLGLDLARFEADRRSAAVAARVQRDLRGALRAGVTVTPTLFAGGRMHAGAPDDALLQRLASGDSE
ncbi:MAG: DsbA family protein [Solirubrobacteraceae bacterium]